VALMFNIAPNFDGYPPIKAILTDQSLPEAERMPMLILNLPAEAWSAAESARQEELWPTVEESS
jgi:hypothetical protein